MKLIAFFLLAALLLAAPGAARAGGFRAMRGHTNMKQPSTSGAAYVPGEMIVGFRAATEPAAFRLANERVGASVRRRFRAFGLDVVRVPPGLSLRRAIHEYQRVPGVVFAEPNYLRYPAALPTDGLFNELWALNNTGQSHAVADADGDDTATPQPGSPDSDIDAPEAWALQEGSGVAVGVIDSGVDVSQPDLASQLWTNPGETPADGLDNDGNGKIDDLNGWDFGDDDATLLSGNHFEGFDHGTHVAGTIAAALDNTTGVVGVCPQCRIMVLKIAHDASGAMTVSAEVAALAYAKAQGVKIVNMSFGGPGWSHAERDAIHKSGVLAVVAAGNDSLDNDMLLAADVDGDGEPDVFSPGYPAAYTLPNILTVAASNDRDENGYSSECHSLGFSKPRCAFTNWGHDSVDVSAPGVDITSTVPGSAWETWDGTSMAAPHVAGVAALVLAQHPAYSVAQMKNAVMHSVDRPASLKTMFIAPPGATTKTGTFTRTAGRVNAFAALSASPANATPLTDGNVDGAKAMSGNRVSGRVAWPADVNDVRKRRLKKGRRYKVTLVVPPGADYDLYVWKPGTSDIWQPHKLVRAGRHAGAADEVVIFRAQTTGTYYLQASAWLFERGRYTLKIVRAG